MNPYVLVKALREGAAVQRCHTHDGPRYTVGEHSAGVAYLLLALMPTPPSADLLSAALLHDIPERWTGDVPAWAKWSSPELARALEALEARILNSLGLEAPRLDSFELHWLKAADSLDLWLWCKNQQRRGFSWAGSITENLEGHLERNPPPSQITDFMHWYRQHPEGLPDAAL